MPRDDDSVLEDGRNCIEASTTHPDKDTTEQFDGELPIVYRAMALVLDDRGVYEEALRYAKDSLSLQPANAFGLDIESQALLHLRRFGECASAAQAAVKSSDGKFPYMHFHLGSCYYEMEDWARAESSFRLAAQADKGSAEAAFNLALSLKHQGFGGDAHTWFEEALRRNPNAELKKVILMDLNK